MIMANCEEVECVNVQSAICLHCHRRLCAPHVIDHGTRLLKDADELDHQVDGLTRHLKTSLEHIHTGRNEAAKSLDEWRTRHIDKIERKYAEKAQIIESRLDHLINLENELEQKLVKQIRQPLECMHAQQSANMELLNQIRQALQDIRQRSVELEWSEKESSLPTTAQTSQEAMQSSSPMDLHQQYFYSQFDAQQQYAAQMAAYSAAEQPPFYLKVNQFMPPAFGQYVRPPVQSFPPYLDTAARQNMFINTQRATAAIPSRMTAPIPFGHIGFQPADIWLPPTAPAPLPLKAPTTPPSTATPTGQATPSKIVAASPPSTTRAIPSPSVPTASAPLPLKASATPPSTAKSTGQATPAKVVASSTPKSSPSSATTVIPSPSPPTGSASALAVRPQSTGITKPIMKRPASAACKSLVALFKNVSDTSDGPLNSFITKNFNRAIHVNNMMIVMLSLLEAWHPNNSSTIFNERVLYKHAFIVKKYINGRDHELTIITAIQVFISIHKYDEIKSSRMMSTLLEHFFEYKCFDKGALLDWYTNGIHYGYKGFTNAKRWAEPFINQLNAKTESEET